MPFKSEKQRRFLWSQHPDIAKRWADEYPGQKNLPLYAHKKEPTDKEKAAAMDELNRQYNVNTVGLRIYNECVKKANSGLIKVEIPHSDKPVAAGDEQVTAENQGEDKASPVQTRNEDEVNQSREELAGDLVNNGAHPLLKKLAVVLSQPIMQAMENEKAEQEARMAAKMPQNAGIKRYATPAVATPMPMGMQQPAQPAPAPAQQPAQPQQQGTGMNSPSANPINSFGALSTSGNINGNAAFGTKNSPDSSKSAFHKWAYGVWDEYAVAERTPWYDFKTKNKLPEYLERAQELAAQQGYQLNFTNERYTEGVPGKEYAKKLRKLQTPVGEDDDNFPHFFSMHPRDSRSFWQKFVNAKQQDPKHTLDYLHGHHIDDRNAWRKHVDANWPVYRAYKEIYETPEQPAPVTASVAAPKTAAANTPCSCGCGSTVSTCKCGPDCSCRKPGGSCCKTEKTSASSPAWQRSAGKNDEGGLNEKGRKSYENEHGGNLKPPVTESNPSGDRAKRQNSFCSRMCGMKSVNTGAATAKDPNSRINKSLRKWNCKCSALELAKQADLEVMKGGLGSRALASTIGHLGAFPLMTLLSPKSHVNPTQWEGPGGSYLTSNISADDTRAQKLTGLAKDMERANPEELKDHRVYLGGGDFFRELPRIFKNPRTSLLGKTWGTLTHPLNTLLPAISRGSMYNPFTNSTYLMGNKPGVLTHELGHAIDFNSGKVPEYSDKEHPAATWFKRQGKGLGHDLYTAGRMPPLYGPFHALGQEERANTLSEKNLRKTYENNPEALNKILDDRQRILPAGIGSYVGNAAAPFLGPAGYVLAPTIGALAGKAYGVQEARRRKGDYAEDKPEEEQQDDGEPATIKMPERSEKKEDKKEEERKKAAGDGLSMAPVYGALLGAAGGAVGNAFRYPNSWGDVGILAAYATGNDGDALYPGRFPSSALDSLGRNMAEGAIVGGGAGVGYDALKLMFGGNKAEAEMPEEDENMTHELANKSASQLYKSARPLGLDNYSSFAGPDQIQHAVQQYGQLKALVRPDDSMLKSRGLNRGGFQSSLRSIARHSQDKDRYDLSELAPNPNLYAGAAAGLGLLGTAGLGYLGGMDGAGVGLAGTGAGVAAAYLHAVNKRKNILNTAKLMKEYGLLKPKLLQKAYPLLADDYKVASVEEFAATLGTHAVQNALGK